MPKIVNTLAVAVATLALAVTFIAAGFAACAVPNATTELLSRAFSVDTSSPFTKDELVSVAVATKDYTVGTHNEAAAYAAVLDINRSAAADGRAGRGAPDVASLGANPSVEQIETAFEKADESYVLTPDAMSHLDDVFGVVSAACIWLIVIAILVVAACAHVAIRVSRLALGGVLLAAGVGVLTAFALLAAWVAVDFNGFFAMFHSLFFAAGSWTFSYDSLLITMYPSEFWIGMGAVWLIVTVALSILSIIVGSKLRKARKAA